MSTNEQKINETQSDISELETLVGQAARPNNKQLLTTRLDQLRQELTKLQKSEQDRLARLNNPNPTPITGYIKKIDTYGWDQSEKFVKIYLTGLKELDKLKEGDVTCDFTDKSFDLIIRNLNNITYTLTLNNLLNKIVPADSYFKVKPDMVTVFLKKADTTRSWSCLLGLEAKIKDKPMPKMDENADPQDGLMSLMKKMYEDGDDEMKRTISKAFTESREKKGMGGMGEMDGMMGM